MFDISSLVWVNDNRKDVHQLLVKGLRGNFVVTVCEGYGSDVGDGFDAWVAFFGNGNDEGGVKGL